MCQRAAVTSKASHTSHGTAPYPALTVTVTILWRQSRDLRCHVQAGPGPGPGCTVTNGKPERPPGPEGPAAAAAAPNFKLAGLRLVTPALSRRA